MTLYAPFLPADFWQLDAERARIQEAGAAEAETAFKVFHEKRMREVDALAARDSALYTEDKNARRLKNLSSDERAAIEANVTALIDRISSETPPYSIYFESKDGWHCKCDKCNTRGWRREV
jgi:hypothetical protein